MALKNDRLVTERDIEKLNNFMGVFVIVLFVGFTAMFGTIATLVIAHFDNSQATYQNLRDQVQAQNAAVKAQSDDIKALIAQLKHSTVTPNQ